MVWAILTLAVAAGAALALARLKVWALILTTMFLALIAAAVGAHIGLTLGRVAIIAFAVAMVCQASYLTAAALTEVQIGHRSTGRIPSRQEIVRAVRAAIAEELPKYFAASLADMPPQLRDKLSLLDAR